MSKKVGRTFLSLAVHFLSHLQHKATTIVGVPVERALEMACLAYATKVDYFGRMRRLRLKALTVMSASNSCGSVERLRMRNELWFVGLHGKPALMGGPLIPRFRSNTERRLSLAIGD